MFPNLLLTLSMSIALSGCFGSGGGADDPKKTLTEYISRTFSVKKVEDRDSLGGYLTGEAKARLVAWSPEQFREAFIDTRRDFLKLSFREVKNVSPSLVSITYELSYLDRSKGTTNAKVTNRKLCEIRKENGKWLISNVRNIKELVEYQNELSLP